MLVTIIGTDAPNSLAARKQSRAAHLVRLDALEAAGKLIVAGPMPNDPAGKDLSAGFSGSVIIAEFENLEAAQAWADADPYCTAGVYASVAVRPFVQVYPSRNTAA